MGKFKVGDQVSHKGKTYKVTGFTGSKVNIEVPFTNDFAVVPEEELKSVSAKPEAKKKGAR
jgi:hypothetical protein